MLWFFLAFVLFSTYGLLNLVVGVIVESTLTACKYNAERALKKKQNDKKQAMHHIRTAFEQMDEDGSGTLSIDELTKAIDNPEIATRLRTVDFPLDDPGQVRWICPWMIRFQRQENAISFFGRVEGLGTRRRSY